MRTGGRRTAVLILPILALSATFTAGSVRAEAAGQIRYVARNGDDSGGSNPCTDAAHPCRTVQHGVTEAQPGDTVSVGAGTYAEHVTVDHSVTIVGAGRNDTIVKGSAAPTFGISSGSGGGDLTVALQHLAVSGNTDNSGIMSSATDLTVDDVVVSANRRDGIADNSTKSLIENSTISNNGSSGFHGGGQSVIFHSTVTGNSFGGVLLQSGSVTVEASTIVQNVALGVGAASQGATPIHIDLRNSTVTGTLAGHGILGRAVFEGGLTGFPIDDHPDPDRVITTSGSIIADQQGVPDCSHANSPPYDSLLGPITDDGYNLSSDAANSCGFGAADHDLVKTVPRLGTLADNGGPTKTRVPLKGSPALDAIPNGTDGCRSSSTDQRGIARPQPTGGRCDVGAVEMAAKPITIRNTVLPTGSVGREYNLTLSATGGAYPTYLWSIAHGKLPDGLGLSAGGTISGTPTRAGRFTFTVSVNDPIQKTFTMTISPTATSATTSTSTNAVTTASSGGSGASLANSGSNLVPLSVTGAIAILVGLVALALAARSGAHSTARRRRPKH